MVYNGSMNKVIVIPDSFKGFLSSREVIDTVTENLQRRFPQASITGLPVADGGEGTVEAMITGAGGHYETVRVCGPYGEEMECRYGIIDSRNWAVIEVASCAGLPLVKGHKNPALTTTYGVGQQILEAIDKDVNTVIIGLGGSCTNDGGCGLASAVGVRFTDDTGRQFVPTGQTLNRIAHIDVSGIKTKDVKIMAMCDIRNPLYGPMGAAYVYSPQKGADEAMIERLDQGLRHLAEVAQRDLGVDITVPGSGAAGGIGGGLYGILNAELRMGIEVVLETVGFEERLQDCDLVITGEGSFDEQSLHGKAISGIASVCKKHDVDCIIICGRQKEITTPLEEIGIKAVYATSNNKKPADRQQAIELMNRTLDSIAF